MARAGCRRPGFGCHRAVGDDPHALRVRRGRGDGLAGCGRRWCLRHRLPLRFGREPRGCLPGRQRDRGDHLDRGLPRRHLQRLPHRRCGVCREPQPLLRQQRRVLADDARPGRSSIRPRSASRRSARSPRTTWVTPISRATRTRRCCTSSRSGRSAPTPARARPPGASPEPPTATTSPTAASSPYVNSTAQQGLVRFAKSRSVDQQVGAAGEHRRQLLQHPVVPSQRAVADARDGAHLLEQHARPRQPAPDLQGVPQLRHRERHSGLHGRVRQPVLGTTNDEL